MRKRTLNFPTTKNSCGTRWGKNGRSGSILAWRMDDGWWGGRQRKKEKNQPQQNKKVKSPQSNRPGPQSKAKKQKATQQLGPNRYRREMFICASQEKNQTKCNGKENQHHVMQLFIRLEAGQGMRIWISVSTWWNVQYVWVCMTTYVATIWGEGTMFSLVKTSYTALCCTSTFENTWVWGFKSLRNWKKKKTLHTSCKNVSIQFQ